MFAATCSCMWSLFVVQLRSQYCRSGLAGEATPHNSITSACKVLRSGLCRFNNVTVRWVRGLFTRAYWQPCGLNHICFAIWLKMFCFLTAFQSSGLRFALEVESKRQRADQQTEHALHCSCVVLCPMEVEAFTKVTR